MNGVSHAASGAVFGLLVSAWSNLPPKDAILFSALTAGGATLPDIDHPDSHVARSLGGVTRLFARAVNAVSGGHRHGTHSGPGIGAFAVLLGAATALHTGQAGHLVGGLVAGAALAAVAIPVRLFDRNPQPAYATPVGGILAAVAVGTFALTLAALAVWQGRVVGTVVLGAVMALALAAAVRTVRLSRGMVDELLAVAAVVVSLHAGMDWSLAGQALVTGAIVHVIGDTVTEGGCPLGWPLSSRFISLELFRTGGWTERYVVRPAIAVAAGVAALAWGIQAALVATLVVGLWLVAGSSGEVQKPRRKGRGRAAGAKRKAAGGARRARRR